MKHQSSLFQRISRREFLRDTSLGVASVAASGRILGIAATSTQAQESGKKLGFALVGLGSLSTNQIAPALQKTRLCRLAGIVSGTPAKAKTWSEKYNIPEKNIYNYQTYDKIAENPDIDVIYVVLPNSMHPEYTVRAAQAGKHVLCEKPMANSANECEQMIAACKTANRKLAIGYRCQFERYHRPLEQGRNQFPADRSIRCRNRIGRA
jgi:hypothetical protein